MSQAGIIGFNSSGLILSLTGNVGGPVFPVGNNINVVTANSTVLFSGATPTLTLDFGLRNLFLGVVPPLAGGDENVAIGFSAGQSITSGIANVIIGFDAGTNLTNGTANVIVGDAAMTSSGPNTDECVAIGANALQNFTGSSGNTAVGFQSLIALVNGSNNAALGIDSGSNYNGAESDNICILNNGQNGENGVTRIGTNGNQTACYIAGIDGVNVGSVATVVTEASDQLGTAVIAGSGGIVITPSANQILIDGSGAGSSVVLTGNSGTATGPAINVLASTGQGSSLITGDNVSTLTLSFTDVDFNVVLGTSTFEATRTVGVAVANVGLGAGVFNSITDGSGNTALGFDSLTSVTTGQNNVGISPNALNSLTTGSSNVAISASMNSLVSGNDNIAIGGTSGSAYTTNESSNILINNVGVIGESNKLRIGTSGSGTNQVNATYIAGIDGVNVGSVARVVTEASDQLGTAVITAGGGITVTPGANTITISATGTTSFNYTNVNTTPYVVLITDDYLSVDSSGGPISVLLPNAAALGQVFIIKDRTGSAATNNITVTTVGGLVNIDGATTFVMNTAFESIQVIGNGSTYEIF